MAFSFVLRCIYLVDETEKELTWISIKSMLFLKIVVLGGKM